ncbi:MAG: DUF1588 domain-containing protein [Planctomycetaceae bacterium]
MIRRIFILGWFSFLALPPSFAATCGAQDSELSWASSLIVERCAGCHGEENPSGKLTLAGLSDARLSSFRADDLWKLFKVVESAQMPPETEEPLSEADQNRLIAVLKTAFHTAAAQTKPPAVGVHRLTRLQYNNAVRDLFQLDRDVFELPEKLMLRQDNSLSQALQSGVFPAEVRVTSNTLRPRPGLSGVQPFPRDLPAEHGFDNQADKLTLSPLLLEAFLRLSVSIVESPDFNAQSVGIWNQLFAAPDDVTKYREVIEQRLSRFLRRAFRSPVDEATVRRYADHAEKTIAGSGSFESGMKQTASAILCSPRFLFLLTSGSDDDKLFERATQLSFFLWNSIPDDALLDLAESKALQSPDVLERAADRMMADPKIERFLDAFPAQWLRLENLFAATPDAAKSPYFLLDEDHPASRQMVLEPLVLFDSLFAENRPVRELIDAPFAYRSDFLQTWYETDLNPSQQLIEQVTGENNARRERQAKLTSSIEQSSRELKDLLTAARTAKEKGQEGDQPNAPVVDLQPYAVWDFEGDLSDRMGRLPLTAHGDIQFENGAVVLKDSFLQSDFVGVDLKAKSFEVWCELPQLDQRGGGLISLQGPNTIFDAIVMGERRPNEWISGSNSFQRTTDFEQAIPESSPQIPLHLVMVYRPNGTIQLYRNGESYGRPYHRPGAMFPGDQSFILFGLRHLPAGGNRFLNVRISKARLFDRALTQEEIQLSFEGRSRDYSDEELTALLGPEQKQRADELKKQLTDDRQTLAGIDKPLTDQALQAEIRRRHDEKIRAFLREDIFRRQPRMDARYGGVITNAAVLTMTSGRSRTQPIARGAWIVDVIFNDPPPPPPNDVPPLNEESLANVPIREQFAIHRSNASCAGCHSRIDPLGFALENYDITGRWRTAYEGGAAIDSGGTLFRRDTFQNAVEFQAALLKDEQRFSRALAAHLFRYALARELSASDHMRIEAVISEKTTTPLRLRTLIRSVALRAFEESPANR